MAAVPRRGRRRRGSWEREAALFRRAALGCYAAALPLAGLGLRSRVAWLAVGATLLAGLCCERGAAFAHRFARRAPGEDDDAPRR
jgi:hypothetical protein